jgi:hypothetical protein
MSVYVEPGLYVRIEEAADGPRPLPLASGFTPASAYRVLGMESFSESSDTYLMLANDRDEIWFISARHVRACALRPDDVRLRWHPGERAYPMKAGHGAIERPAAALPPS